MSSMANTTENSSASKNNQQSPSKMSTSQSDLQSLLTDGKQHQNGRSSQEEMSKSDSSSPAALETQIGQSEEDSKMEIDDADSSSCSRNESAANNQSSKPQAEKTAEDEKADKQDDKQPDLQEQVKEEQPQAPEFGEDGRRIVRVPETEVDDEECGFPAPLRQFVLRGKAIPINKKTWTEIEIDGNDSILDCASQVVPLMIKKPDLFPPKLVLSSTSPAKEKKEKASDENAEEDGEDVQVIEQKVGGEPKPAEGAENADATASTVAAKAAQPPPPPPLQPANQNKSTMLTISDFYKSNIGSFLMGIGLSRAKEVYHKDLIKQTQKLIRKEGDFEEHTEELRKQNQLHSECKAANAIFNFKMHKCHMCEFKSESEAVMDLHYATPHLSNRKEYKCSYCVFLTRDPRTIEHHYKSQHRKPCNVQMPPFLYECPTCNYESNQKAKALAHVSKCTKTFIEDSVQATSDPENEYPAITPKPITQEDIKMYEATLQALRPVILNPGTQLPNIPGLPRGLQQQMLQMHQQQYNQQRQKLGNRAFPQPNLQRNQPGGNAVATQANVAAAIRNLQSHGLSSSQLSNQLSSLMNNPNAAAALGLSQTNGSNLFNNINLAKNAAPQLYNMLQTGANAAQLAPQQHKLLNQANAAQQLQQLKNRLAPSNTTLMMMQQKQQTLQNKPNLVSKPIGLMPQQQQQQHQHQSSHHSQPHSHHGSGTPGSRAEPIGNGTTGGTPTSSSSSKGTFVICEICDGYIKDLDQLRTHMQWIHKVKIHPKMLASRPPLNCQKCQWRFFTDQGLERHLLGAHGLVTTNMQEMVDQNQDGGRCTICGRVFALKLVAHMSQAHKITLRPAHLSYKCTVCSATFNLYRLFESHVYMVHSGSVKRSAEDGSQASKRPKLDFKSLNGHDSSLSSAHV